MEFCNDFALKKNHWINSVLLVSDDLPVRMPRKRSKSERERKRIYRQNRTPEKIATDQENDRKKKKEALRKKTEEAKKQENNARMAPRIYFEKEENRKGIMKLSDQQTGEEKKLENEKAKDRMLSIRAKKAVEDEEQEREEDKKRVITAERSTEEFDYERIVQRQGKRTWRQGLSGKDRLEGNLIAKKGMQLLNIEGRLRSFSHREAGLKRTRKKDNLYEWKQYMKKVRNEKKFL